MTESTNAQAIIVRTSRGLSIADTCITLYQVMDYVKAGWPPELIGYPLKAGQLTYDCRYSTMHGMAVTGNRGFRGLKPLWYNSVPP